MVKNYFLEKRRDDYVSFIQIITCFICIFIDPIECVGVFWLYSILSTVTLSSGDSCSEIGFHQNKNKNYIKSGIVIDIKLTAVYNLFIIIGRHSFNNNLNPNFAVDGFGNLLNDLLTAASAGLLFFFGTEDDNKYSCLFFFSEIQLLIEPSSV